VPLPRNVRCGPPLLGWILRLGIAELRDVTKNVRLGVVPCQERLGPLKSLPRLSKNVLRFKETGLRCLGTR
jgi:hypothetical protein